VISGAIGDQQFADRKHLVTGHWSLATGHWSLVTGHFFMVGRSI
jgi:hypothetical protein